MISDSERFWPMTMLAAGFAIAFAVAGGALRWFAPDAPALLGTGFLAVSLAATATAFGLVAARVRRLEMENTGLVEEMTQQFERVRSQMDVFDDALSAPRSITPEEEANTPMRRVPLK